tara:strand:+ start:149 stop:1603 length:1455 start_codon:yes stop_codon:yes gene_type:complete
MTTKLSYGYWKRKIGIYNKHEKTVKNLYSELLKRPATDDEIEHYGVLLKNNEIDSGSIKKLFTLPALSVGSVNAGTFLDLKEREKIVKNLYSELLKRPATDAEIEPFGILLKNPKIDFDSIKKMLPAHADFLLAMEREKIVKDAYMDVLKRPATDDEVGFLTTLFSGKNMDKNIIHKVLLDPEELKSINNWTHYSLKYWNDLPAVVKYMNKCATDNPNCIWMEDILSRFSEYIPFENVLVIGCGNGWLERDLYQLGIGKNFDAFDISDEYIQEAEKQKKLFFNRLKKNKVEDRTDLNGEINYFVLDITELEKLKAKKYDAVFNYAILHHVQELEIVLTKIRQLMKVNALIFNVEYIGPDKNQYSDQHVAVMEKTLKKIPEKFRTPHQLKPNIINFRVDPSEALHSSMIKHTIEKFFDIIFQRNLNGGVAYALLWNFTEKFENEDDQESVDCLDFLLKEDALQSKNGQVPILFWYGVGKKSILRT